MILVRWPKILDKVAMATVANLRAHLGTKLATSRSRI